MQFLEDKGLFKIEEEKNSSPIDHLSMINKENQSSNYPMGQFEERKFFKSQNKQVIYSSSSHLIKTHPTTIKTVIDVALEEKNKIKA